MYDLGICLLCQRKAIRAVPLTPQTERFQPLEQKERAERVHAWSNISEHLSAHFDRKSYMAELVTEDHSVVAF